MVGENRTSRYCARKTIAKRGSIRAEISGAPVLAGTKFVIRSLIMPFGAGRSIIDRDEPVTVAAATIMRGFHFVPDDEAICIHAALVDAHGFDLAADHQAVLPRPCPGDG